MQIEITSLEKKVFKGDLWVIGCGTLVEGSKVVPFQFGRICCRHSSWTLCIHESSPRLRAAVLDFLESSVPFRSYSVLGSFRGDTFEELKAFLKKAEEEKLISPRARKRILVQVKKGLTQGEQLADILLAMEDYYNS